MKKAALPLIIIAFAVCAWADGPNDRKVTDPKSVSAPQNASAKPVQVEDLYFTNEIFDAAWSPTGTEITYTGNPSGRFNIWKMKADGSGAQQLTKSDEKQVSPVWTPDGKYIVFQQDKGGDEVYDLFMIPSGGGAAPENLTNTADTREDRQQFSKNGQWLAYDSKPTKSAATDIMVMDWKTRKTRVVSPPAPQDHFWTLAFWSPDEKYLFAMVGDRSFEDTDVYRIEVSTGKAENLTAHSGKQKNLASAISPDGKTLLITSSANGGFDNVALLDIASKQKKWITQTQWEASGGDWSPKGDRFSYSINADGRKTIYLAKADGGGATKVPLVEGINEEAGNPHAFSPDGTKLLVSHEDSTRPSDLWTVPMDGSKPAQLTHSARASLTSVPLPQSQVVTYKSFDGKLISAFLWLPFNVKRDGSNPAIVYPHGGPTGQTEDRFSPIALGLASRGYIVIAPNVRGSTGYGIDFQHANYQDLGGGDLKDEVYGVNWLKQTGYVDAKKIGISGGSYGGFMTLMAIGREPDIWAAAVELFGIIDWKTMLQHSDPFLQQYIQGLLGDPVKDVEVYEAASPIKYIHNVKAPLLILQGERDVRVPAEEARQVEAILKKEGKVVDSHYYPDEGHGWYKREDSIDSLNRVIAWFDKYLKGAAPNTQARK